MKKEIKVFVLVLMLGSFLNRQGRRHCDGGFCQPAKQTNKFKEQQTNDNGMLRHALGGSSSTKHSYLPRCSYHLLYRYINRSYSSCFGINKVLHLIIVLFDWT